ncbi:hypothetical protein C2S51_029546 [Perilla frutescens var. frutescens]|nr:hypothetical protein C2S51_029546 [Perilla frutescens var. frutescens]
MVSDLRQQYGAPFLITTPNEGNRYLTLRSHEISCPRYIDWKLMRELNLESQIMEYLKVLNMQTFARMQFYAYDNVVLEFLVSFQYDEDERKSCTFRMFDVHYNLTLAELRDYFDFPTTGIKHLPSDFNAADAWYEISGFRNWNTKGIPRKFIEDPALSVVHKFLAYSISGKEQANKMNSTEVFLLWCAKKGRKVCPSTFILSIIKDAVMRKTQHPSFCAFISALCAKIGALDENAPAPHGYRRLDAHAIDKRELKRAEVIYNEREVRPHAKRTCVGTLKQIQCHTMEVTGGSSSAPREPNEEGDKDEHAAGGHQGGHAGHQGYHIPATDWSSFQGYMDTTMDQFQQSITDTMSSFGTQLQDSMSTYRQEHNARMMM